MVSLQDPSVIVGCNETCCIYEDNHTFCSINYNYTAPLWTTPTWEMAVRWSYVVPVVVLGVAGNLSIIVILMKNRVLMKTSINHFILNMSVADLIIAIVGPIPYTIRDTHQFWPLGRTWCYLEGYIQIMVMLVSVTSLATISFDRMVGVAYPFHHHMKAWQSLVINMLIWVFSAGLAVPFGIYRVYTVRIWADVTQTHCSEKYYKLQIWYYVVIIVLTWIPIIVMVISYAIIFWNFKKYVFKVQGREHPAVLHTKKRVVRMMFVVVLVFIVSWLPFQIAELLHSYFYDDNEELRPDRNREVYNDLLSVAQYMIYLMPAVNPIVYALMHQNFRRAFKVTFPCFFHRPPMFVLTKGQPGERPFFWSRTNTTQPVPRPQTSRFSQRGRHAVKVPDHIMTSIIKMNITPDRIMMPIITVELASDPELKFGGTKNSVFVEESFVHDLVPVRRLTKSTLGQLIVQVIEEEHSSELDSDRVF